MAKENAEQAANASAAEAVAGAKPPKVQKTAAEVAAGGSGGGGGRAVVLDIDGKKVNRADFIRDRWQNGKISRSEITKEVNAITAKMDPNAKAVPYQVIFAATKGLEGGPAVAAKPAATAEGSK